MSITQVISRNEKNLEILENLSQVPRDVLNELEMKYDEINQILEDVADNYGDEDEDNTGSDVDEDTW